MEYENYIDSEQPIMKKERRKYYTSNIPESYIRHAISGGKYPYKVGSYDSLRFYRHIDATGFCDSDGRPYPKTEKNISREPNMCYYSSPEECMSHRNVTIDPSRVKAWHEFQNKVFPGGGEFNKKEYLKYKESRIQ